MRQKVVSLAAQGLSVRGVANGFNRMHGDRMAGPHRAMWKILAIIDQGSRRLLRLAVLPDKGADTLVEHLNLAIDEWGLPAAIRTDNEAMFTSETWRDALNRLGSTTNASNPTARGRTAGSSDSSEP